MISDQEVLAALHFKEAELVRELESIVRKMERLRADLAEVRAVAAFHRQNIANLDFMPHMSVRALFRRNEILGYCLDAFAAAGGSLDTRQLASKVIERKGLDIHDQALRKKLVYSVMQVMKSEHPVTAALRRR